ncbi:hypothetical protein BOTBODRAFT_40029 [Botryobasidium botryosum FD-172 SS1]|uniref:F-box domain-containing protein n=1 Tax=Botryobasidium botryosum (strain FD-172 SS1) TaxID=930990 RepID=A0A067LR98_BOTB1|nr:hypothetical protein BOTBODRAFT_40029 [Botryobasidium botryosum FD-172 SS1]
MGSPPFEFPPEVIIQVIEELDLMGYPHPLAYDRSAANTTALCQLSLASRSLHAWTAPFLYRCVSLTTPVQISLFARTLKDPIHCGSKPKHVQTIRFSGFDLFLHARSVRNICTTLHATSPSLQRLFIELPLICIDSDQPNNVKYKQQPLSHAFRGLSPHMLVEFVSGHDDLFLGHLNPGSAIWSNWTGLRRLALCRAYPDDSFFHMLSRLPLLEILVLTDALDIDGQVDGSLPPSLRRITLITTGASLPVLRATQWEERISAMGVERGAPVDFVRIILPKGDWAPDWTKQKAATGELWGIDRTEFIG